MTRAPRKVKCHRCGRVGARSGMWRSLDPSLSRLGYACNNDDACDRRRVKAADASPVTPPQ